MTPRARASGWNDSSGWVEVLTVLLHIDIYPECAAVSSLSRSTDRPNAIYFVSSSAKRVEPATAILGARAGTEQRRAGTAAYH